MKCPICGRRVIVRLCPVHGDVVGGGPRSTTDIRTVGTINSGVDSIADTITTATTPIVGQVIPWYGDAGSLPAGWADTGIDLAMGSIHYLRYTG